MEKEKSVINDEIRQTRLKKDLRKLKKKIPYSILIFSLITIVLIYLLEGKLYKFIGNNYNLIWSIGLCLAFLLMIYLIIIIFKIKTISKEIKSLGAKMYNKMKL